jgi:hypothetical protein
MKKFAVGVVLLAVLGAACAKAGSDNGPVPDASESSLKAASQAAADAYVGSLDQLVVGSLRVASQAAADAYVESLQQSAVDYESGLAKAALVEAGITNLSGTTTTAEGELPSGAPRPQANPQVGPHPHG